MKTENVSNKHAILHNETATTVLDAPTYRHPDEAKAKLVDRHEEICRCETCKIYA